MRNFGGVVAIIAIFLSKCVHSELFRHISLGHRDEELGVRFDGDFRFSQCADLDSTVQIVDLEVYPKQFILHQNISMSITLNITKEVIKPMVKVEVFKKMPVTDHYVKVPCILNYGSCTYKDSCRVLAEAPKDSLRYKTACPQWVESSGIECKCPFKQGVYGVKNITVPTADDAIPKWIVAGDYKITLIIMDNTQTAVCYKFQFRLK